VLYGDRLYLNRMWHNERAVARFFGEVNYAIEVDEQRLTHTLAALFPPVEGVNWQSGCCCRADPPYIGDLRRTGDRKNNNGGEASGGVDSDGGR
jgi:hypothetical protein